MNTQNFLNWLFNHSLQGGLIVLCVLAVQRFLNRQLTHGWRFALWWLVIVRLLLPFGPASAWSLFNHLQLSVRVDGPNYAVSVTGAAAPIESPSKSAGGRARFSPPLAEPLVGTPAASSRFASPPSVQAAPRHFAIDMDDLLIPGLLGVWLAGVAALSGVVVVQVIRFSRRLRRSAQRPPREVVDALAACQRELGISRRIELLETDVVGGPALFGLWRLRLLLPVGLAARFEQRELRYIFLHELAHVQRGDLWIGWLATLLQILHWFNPLIWLGFARMRADRELACDEMTLQYTAEKTGAAYGSTLLKLHEALRRPAAIPGLVGILEDRKQMKRRITMITRFKKPTRWSALAALALMALGLLTLTDAQPGEPPGQPNAVPASTNEIAKLVQRGLSAQTNQAQLEAAIRSYKEAIDRYDSGRKGPATEIFQLGECYRQLGKTNEANVQYRRILEEFPEQAELVRFSQQFLLGLPNPPPAYVRSYGDSAANFADNISYPGGVAIDPAGDVYISDTRNDRIQKFSRDGVVLAKWGAHGAGPGDFDYPQSVAINAAGQIYVADTHNNRIQKLAADGTFLSQWGHRGPDAGDFMHPYSVALDKAGNVYVADTDNHRIQKFTADGSYLAEFGGSRLQVPKSVAVSQTGIVYVGDEASGRIETFSVTGAFVGGWGSYDNAAKGTGQPQGAAAAGGSAPARGQLGQPHDVAVDARGDVFMVDDNDRVLMFNSEGRLLTLWGRSGDAPGAFNFSTRVAVDPSGSNIYICDANNSRVELFSYLEKK